MKNENVYYVAAINTTNRKVLSVSTPYTDKTDLERKYGAWCIRMILEGQDVLDNLETVSFEILQSVFE